MAYNTPGEVLTDIANSIRTLHSSTSPIAYVDMPRLIKGAIPDDGIDLSDYNGTNWILSFIDHVDFSGMASMNGLFSEIDRGTSTPAHSLEFENFSVNVSCDQLFYYSRFTDLNLSGWEIASTATLNRTFGVANIQNLNLTNWDISSPSLSVMFYGATIGSIDFSGWDTSEVTNMKDMFMTATVTKMWVPSTFVATAVVGSSNKPFNSGNLVIYTDATDATTQGWGTIGPNVVIHYNSTYQDFINA